MRKPWQIWSIFALILCVVVPLMGWLTWQINETDRAREEDRVQTELARQEAELQERISSALYRMDWWATPLVAQEAARPYYLYEPFYRVSNASSVRSDSSANARLSDNQSLVKNRKSTTLASLPDEVQQPSPLLFETSEFVVMHFQISSDDVVTSPQRPLGSECERAVACGIPKSKMESNDDSLKLATLFCKYDEISKLCPDLPRGQTVPGPQVGSVAETGVATFQTVYRDPQFNPYTGSIGNSNNDSTLALEQAKQALVQQVMQMQGPISQGIGVKNEKLDQQVDRNRSRGNTEFYQRAISAEKNARSQWAQNQLNSFAVPPGGDGLIREGVMRPLWLGDRLILARRVEGANKKLVQCCWLNWDLIQQQLKSEIADILPEVEFEPVRDPSELKFGRAMATLPVHLIVDSQKLLSTLALDSPAGFASRPSGLKVSLLLAWVGLALAAFASALLLKGVMQLSERRAAFVSAVTHELRTPLTTFRMYSEMLAEKMVPADKQHEYAETMKVEADRLSQLVENVLQFARLEKSSGDGRVESLAVGEIFNRFDDRLHQRAEKSEMKLSIELGEAAQVTCSTDAAKVEQIVFNLIDNACKYAAESDDNRINVSASTKRSSVLISVQDFGPGVSAKFKRLLFKPFCKSDQDAADTASGVGLGLALCQKMAKSIGGKIYLSDSKDESKSSNKNGSKSNSNGAIFVLELPV
ncbi:MAG: sensor histidine kinase [Mariniblastus sp.]